MLRKLLHWFGAAICQISASELFALTLNVTAFTLYGNFAQNFYLWAIIVICDLMVIGAHGAWIEACKAQTSTAHSAESYHGPWRAPTAILVRMVAFVVLFILALEHRQDTILSTYIWYTVVVTAICHAFYCILLAMHKTDDSWLEGTHGRIGVPNWISIIRMAISVLVPHLYVVQPFGKASSIIATIAMILAIATDAADGFIARHFNQITKAGKALDPLGDKIIFYPTAVAFLLATNFTAFLPDGPLRWIFFACLATMFARDALFFVWFFLYYTKLKNGGTGAGIVDKVRMAAMCGWLASSALALTLVGLEDRLAICGFVCIAAVAVLSVLSIFVDYARIRPLLTAKTEPPAAESEDDSIA